MAPLGLDRRFDWGKRNRFKTLLLFVGYLAYSPVVRSQITIQGVDETVVVASEIVDENGELFVVQHTETFNNDLPGPFAGAVSAILYRTSSSATNFALMAGNVSNTQIMMSATGTIATGVGSSNQEVQADFDQHFSVAVECRYSP